SRPCAQPLDCFASLAMTGLMSSTQSEFCESLLLVGIGRLRAGADGGTRQLGVRLRLVRPVTEPDVAVDDRVAGDDGALVGGTVAHHPVAAVGHGRRGGEAENG